MQGKQELGAQWTALASSAIVDQFALALGHAGGTCTPTPVISAESVGAGAGAGAGSHGGGAGAGAGPVWVAASGHGTVAGDEQGSTASEGWLRTFLSEAQDRVHPCPDHAAVLTWCLGSFTSDPLPPPVLNKFELNRLIDLGVKLEVGNTKTERAAAQVKEILAVFRHLQDAPPHFLFTQVLWVLVALHPSFVVVLTHTLPVRPSCVSPLWPQHSRNTWRPLSALRAACSAALGLLWPIS